MNIMDNAGQKVLVLHRECKCTLYCWPFCMLNPQTLVVKDAVGTLLGTVVQGFKPCNPNFFLDVLDVSFVCIRDLQIVKLKG